MAKQKSNPFKKKGFNPFKKKGDGDMDDKKKIGKKLPMKKTSKTRKV